MSPLLDVQRRYRELGRLRMGKKAPKGNPVKLDTWRLTSPSRELLEVAAELFGGSVEPWPDAPNEGENWQLTTETDALPIAVPPGEVLSQWWELWSGGGCKKRCDGINQILVARPCSCPSDVSERLAKPPGQACSPVTRLSVLIPEIPDVGVWRLETHGMNAATEIPATYEILRAAAAAGHIIPARLRIEPRTSKKEGKTQRFRVPVIQIAEKLHEVGAAIGQLSAGEGTQDAPQLAPPVEGRTMPGEPPKALHSDAIEGRVVDAAPPPQTTPPAALPEWIANLPGDDGAILDAAMQVAAELGAPQEIRSLHHLAETNPPEAARARIRELCIEAAQEPEPEGEPVQGSLT